jgi:2-iminobutanoate/2-iminopropanoate deaminase
MTHTIRDIGISKHLGRYSDAIETAPGLRWLYTSGTPGLTKDGELPKDLETQTHLVWQNVLEALQQAGMGPADLVKVTTSLTNAKDIPAYVEIRNEVLGDARPASMLSVISELVRPGILVEVEAIAAKV